MFSNEMMFIILNGTGRKTPTKRNHIYLNGISAGVYQESENP